MTDAQKIVFAWMCKNNIGSFYSKQLNAWIWKCDIRDNANVASIVAKEAVPHG